MELKKQIFECITALGSMIFYLIIICFVFLTSLNTDFELFSKLALGFVLSLIIIIPIKYLFFRPRPLGKKKPEKRLDIIDQATFPSQHSTQAFALALIIGLSKNTFTLIFLMVLATLVAVSRIVLKKHYIKDVVSGAAIGTAIGIIVEYAIF